MKVAIIGRGFGQNVMAPGFKSIGWDVEIVPSRDAAGVAAALAQPFDLIAVHSPPFQHREHVLAAIAAGRAVLCDKPFGANAAQAREMRDAAKAAGVLHFLNFEFRTQPARVRAKELVESGAIGTLTHISHSSFGNGFRQRPHGWLHDSEQAGGWIGAWGSHYIDSIRWLTGSEVARCGGMTRTEIAMRPDSSGTQVRSTAEDAFSAWFEMENGVTVTTDTGYAASVNVPTIIHLLGTDGAIAIADEKVLTLRRPKAEPELIDCTPPPDGFFFVAVPLWLERITQALRDGKQIAPNFDDGVAAAEVIDRMKAGMTRAG